MLIFRNLSIISLFICSLTFLYISFILISNISKGFDITDESYYLLAAMFPNEMFSTVTHEGFYTGFLYNLSGHNLKYFRLLGIVLLIIVTYLFAYEFY